MPGEYSEEKKELSEEIIEGFENLNFIRNCALYLQPGSFTEIVKENLPSDANALISFYNATIELKASLIKHRKQYHSDNSYNELEKILNELIIFPLSKHFSGLAYNDAAPSLNNQKWKQWSEKVNKFFNLLVKEGFLENN